jgi:hypothetical protein
VGSIPLSNNANYGNKVTVTNLVLHQVSAIPNSPTNMRQAVISLSTQMNVGDVANPIKTDHFSIYILVDSANKIISCLNSTSEALGQANCVSIGGVWDPNRNPECRIDPTSPSANCAALGGTFVAAANPPCQISPACPVGEIFLGYNAGNPICSTFQALLAGLCPDNNMLSSDGMGNLVCIPIIRK